MERLSNTFLAAFFGSVLTAAWLGRDVAFLITFPFAIGALCAVTQFVTWFLATLPDYLRARESWRCCACGKVALEVTSPGTASCACCGVVYHMTEEGLILTSGGTDVGDEADDSAGR